MIFLCKSTEGAGFKDDERMKAADSVKRSVSGAKRKTLWLFVGRGGAVASAMSDVHPGADERSARVCCSSPVTEERTGFAEESNVVLHGYLLRRLE